MTKRKVAIALQAVLVAVATGAAILMPGRSPEPVPSAGSSVAKATHDQSGTTALRAAAIEVRRILARATR
jgi:hypothetical protein